MNEAVVAFHEIVTFLGWKDSSRSGPKLTFALDSRNALNHFDKATKRRGKKAGQRYTAVLQASNDDGEPIEQPFQVDLWFAGANWAHQEGAKVAFTITDDDLSAILATGWNPRDHGGLAARLWLTLVQLDEDETPINQVAQEKLEAGMAEPERRKGGPNCAAAAILAGDDEFQWYVSERLDEDRGIGLARGNAGEKATTNEADAFIKQVCGVTSKIDFDFNPEAWDKFVQLKRRFQEWSVGG